MHSMKLFDKRINRLVRTVGLGLLTAFLFTLVHCSSVTAAEPGNVDVKIFHHYYGTTTPIEEDIEIEEGDYILSDFFVLSTDTGDFKVYEISGVASVNGIVSFEEGYRYIIDIYYDPIFIVSFLGNGGTPGSQSVSIVRGGSVSLNMPPEPVQRNYIFVEWNTRINGDGDTFNPSSIINSDIDVYAQCRYVSDKGSNEDSPKTGDIKVLRNQINILLVSIVGLVLTSYLMKKRFCGVKNFK